MQKKNTRTPLQCTDTFAILNYINTYYIIIHQVSTTYMYICLADRDDDHFVNRNIFQKQYVLSYLYFVANNQNY